MPVKQMDNGRLDLLGESRNAEVNEKQILRDCIYEL